MEFLQLKLSATCSFSNMYLQHEVSSAIVSPTLSLSSVEFLKHGVSPAWSHQHGVSRAYRISNMKFLQHRVSPTESLPNMESPELSFPDMVFLQQAVSPG
ncbi:hypothetical protein V5799_025379 [Amblyomma americanum]|uniref:Uncharacterized protein n=1 Tax=Amblyomma americanum TaxID=6943 RepID=A0AAQ4E9F3_AMBAM